MHVERSKSGKLFPSSMLTDQKRKVFFQTFQGWKMAQLFPILFTGPQEPWALACDPSRNQRKKGSSGHRQNAPHAASAQESVAPIPLQAGIGSGLTQQQTPGILFTNARGRETRAYLDQAVLSATLTMPCINAGGDCESHVSRQQPCICVENR